MLLFVVVVCGREIKGGGGVTDFLSLSLSCLSLNRRLRSSGGSKEIEGGVGERGGWRNLFSL
jgi:hypothetical protein